MINLCAQKLYLPFSIYVNDKGKRRIRIKNDKNRRDLCVSKSFIANIIYWKVTASSLCHNIAQYKNIDFYEWRFLGRTKFIFKCVKK